MKKKLFSTIILVTLLASVLPSLPVMASSDPGLVGRWHFDEGLGSKAFDSSGNGNDGTLTNMDLSTAWVNGRFGKALNFDGTDDYVQVANEANFDFERTSAFTLEAWIETDSDACLNIISKMDNEAPNIGYQLIKHSSSYGNKLFFFLINNFVDATHGNMIRLYGSTNVADGQWHHVAVTYDGSSYASGVRMYVDGLPETLTVTCDSLTSTILNNLPLQISGRDGSYYAFKRLIDEVRIWNRVLSADQIKAHAWGLVGEWHFNEASGATTFDSSGFGNDGSIYGASWVAAKFDYALRFDGINDYVNIPDSSSLDVDHVTIEAWIYFETTPTSFQNIVRKGPFNDRVYGLDIGATASGKVRAFVVLGSTSGTALIANGGMTLSANMWHHVAMTYDGNYVRVYVDGALDGTSSSSTGVISDNAQAVNVGILQGSGGPAAFNGIIDEVRIWNKALLPVKFSQTGLGSDATGTIVSANDPINLQYPQLPYIMMVKGGSSVIYTYTDPVPAGLDKQYHLTGVSPQTPQTVNGPLTITGTYVAQNAPVAEAGGPYTGTEGTEVTLDASGSTDPDGDTLQYRWDFNNDGTPDTGWLSSSTAQNTWGDDFIGTAKVEVRDGIFTSTDTASVLVNNVPPTITSLTASPTLVALTPLGVKVQASAIFTDPGTLDTHSAIINWGDSGDVSLVTVVSPINLEHTYTATGVYPITLTVTDKDDDSDTEIFEYIVIYDPSAGFVTGGGWIDSPAGAYTADPSLKGKATFGFVSKYQKGVNVPTGNTEFIFHAVSFKFKSTSYDWLVVAGTRAQYKGTGTINGAGNYGFMLTAIDGGTKGSDMFRIKIWDKATDAVVYDNQMGASDTGDPTTAIAGGSIVVHK